MMDIQVNGHTVNCLFDSGSMESFIRPNTVRRFALPVFPMRQSISMASTSHGYCVVNLTVRGTVYNNCRLLVLPQLCATVLLGLDFMCNLGSVTMVYDGSFPPIAVQNPQLADQPPRTTCGLSTLKIAPPLSL